MHCYECLQAGATSIQVTSVGHGQQQPHGLTLRACQPSLIAIGIRHRTATGSAQVIPQKAFATRPASAMIDK